MTVSELTERELIARIHERLAPAPGWLTLGIGDDAAVLEPVRNRLEVLTVDSVVEGVHFDRRFSPPESIGHRAMAVNLSDLAAMGAEPRAALLSMALPATLPVDDLDRIVSGLAGVAATHKIHVVGGNLTTSPGPLMLDVTATGTVKRRGVLTRGGARPHDELYLTGTIGGAAAGLAWLKAGSPASSADMRECVHRYHFVEPRVRSGLLVGRDRAASACMDLSDGLADAVRQVAAASQVGARIDASALPIDPAARDWFTAVASGFSRITRDQQSQDLSAEASATADPIAAALSGGDDYELLFAVPPRRRRAFLAAIRHSGVPVTKIGVCTREREIELQGTSTPFPQGYSHFR